MKTLTLIAEIIIFCLCLHLFYEGVYKLTHWRSFSNWMNHAPLLKPLWPGLAYFIPGFEILVAIGLLTSKFKVQSLYSAIAAYIIFIGWIFWWMTFTRRLFHPYHPLWPHLTWWGIAFTCILISWLAFLALFFTKRKVQLKQPLAPDPPSSELRKHLPVSR